MNDRVYIHEFIDIIGHQRANYMHHMTANWSPTAREQRGQLCYGVWAVLGSTGPWPQTVNMWEEQGWDGLARSFATEAVGRGAQDPALEKWWAAAAGFRRGGTDRIMVPAPWTEPIESLCRAGVGGEVFAHELVRVRPGAATELLEQARHLGAAALAPYRWALVGAFTTAMGHDDEALLLWSIPTWADWGAAEAAMDTDGDLVGWRRSRRDLATAWQRILLVPAPLCPFRTGRQPARDDRTGWED